MEVLGRSFNLNCITLFLWSCQSILCNQGKIIPFLLYIKAMLFKEFRECFVYFLIADLWVLWLVDNQWKWNQATVLENEIRHLGQIARIFVYHRNRSELFTLLQSYIVQNACKLRQEFVQLFQIMYKCSHSMCLQSLLLPVEPINHIPLTPF